MRMTPSSSLSSTPLVPEVDARRIAADYVTMLDSTFAVANGTHYYHKSLGREIWQFIICANQAPLDAILIDAQTSEVIPLTNECEFAPMLLSNFRHRQQQYESDCLVACAEMVMQLSG